ncbi:MAG: hypothetical protein WC876_06880 [Candidatus Thermoplasmatota archaeon]|jgi:hypothetical protein
MTRPFAVRLRPFAILGALSVVTMLLLFSVTATKPVSDDHTICHATGSLSNPYVVLSPDKEGVHDGHLGASHQSGLDIVPPFTYHDEVHSQNWDAVGQAIFANNCNLPATSTSSSSSSSSTSSSSTSESPTSSSTSSSTEPTSHTFCHATASESNPFVTTTTSYDGVHDGHLGDSHQDGDDIVPPFTYHDELHSQNWDSAGQAIFDNGCAAPTTGTSTTTTSTSERPTSTSESTTTTTGSETTSSTPPSETTTSTSETTTTTTQIPVFGSGLAVALGIGGSLVGSLLMLRRRL